MVGILEVMNRNRQLQADADRVAASHDSGGPARVGMKLDYKDLLRQLRQCVSTSSDAAHVPFVLDSIRLLDKRSRAIVAEALGKEEQRLISGIIDGIHRHMMSDVKGVLGHLDQLLGDEGDGSLVLDHRIIFLLDTVDHYLRYQETKDVAYISEISVTMVDSVDYEITMCGVGEPLGYSVKNMLGAPQMVDEFERQVKAFSAR